MRISRTLLLTAAMAVVPAAATTPAFAAVTATHPTINVRHNDDPPPGQPGPPGLTDQQRQCMEQKGFGPPGERKPGDQPPSREDMQKRWHDRMQAAKDCGVTGFPGGGHRFGGPPMNDQQRKCMADKGFAPGMHHMGDQGRRPSREDMEKRRQDFENARKDCGLPAPQFRGGPGDHGPGGPMQQGGPGPQGAPNGPGGKPA
jgi:hypothetical protein